MTSLRKQDDVRRARDEKERLGLTDYNPEDHKKEEPLLIPVENGYRVRGFKEGATWKDSFTLPKFGKDLSKENINRVRQYTIKNHEVPIVIGPMDNLLINGTLWAEEGNKRLEKVTDALPRLPFVWTVEGAINKGKTTLLVTALELFDDPEIFSEIHIYSASLAKDPILKTYLARRSPELREKVKITFQAKISPADIAKFAQEAEEKLAPLDRLAEVGINVDKDAKRQRIKMMMGTFDDITHPFTDQDGVHHGRRPILEDIPNYTPIHPFEQEGAEPVFDPELIDPEYYQDVPRVDGTGSRRRRRQLIGQPTLDRESEQFALFHPKKPTVTFTNPINPQKRGIMQEVADMAVYDPNMSELKAKMERTKDHHLNQYDKGDQRKKPLKRGKLLLLDDCSYAFRGPSGVYFEKFVTEIRHHECCMIATFHKTTATPPIFRVVATHTAIFDIPNLIERKLLSEIFGGIEDFEGKLRAATHVTGERDRDFLLLDIPKKKAYRGLQGEIVELGEGDGEKKEPESEPEPKRRKRASK